ncbi:MAG TPA: hypothetical protein PKD64_05480 [Pirellulaceae bacterium]|nr:hypothetical protein [Pirellulaceae bacterium]HMO91629.1 hypothetical protein [Pirellulaceae bacterium]HMP68326.1 hypothetical protein [Pirellulaceae bacterium]
MSFEEKLKQAIERGQQRSRNLANEEKRRQLTDDEYRRKHTEFRLRISDEIETVLKKVVDHLPGFRYETVFGDKGWGGAIYRDDVLIQNGKRNTFYSRLEIAVRPYSSIKVVELVSKGTVRNQEIFMRNFHEQIDLAELDSFLQSVDQWALEYAEQFVTG